MMHVLGIDPGIKGGIALLGFRENDIENDIEIRYAARMPTEKVDTGPIGRGTIVDVRALHTLFAGWSHYRAVDGEPIELWGAIEQQQVRSKQGGNMATAFNYGIVVACVHAYYGRSGLWYPRASVWKGDLGLTADKERSRTLATSVFGEIDGGHFWPTKGCEGVAEAALLAYWRGRRLRNMMARHGRHRPEDRPA